MMPDFGDPTELDSLIIKQDIEELNLFLKQSERSIYDEKNVLGETPLIFSLRRYCTDEVISTLIDHGCNVNIPDNVGITPLHVAVERDDCYILNLLIEKGAALNAKDKNFGLTVLHTAVLQSSLPNVQALLKHPQIKYNERNNRGLTPLSMSLTLNCNDEIILALINGGCNYNILNDRLETMLHLAVARTTPTIAHELIKKGADVNAMDVSGRTPLHTAVLADKKENVYMLLYYNADANREDFQKWSLFKMALYYSQKEIAEYLIHYMADLNERHFDDNTLLHEALIMHSDLALIMIENGADVNLMYEETQHCINFALMEGHESSDLFETIWSRADVSLLLDSNYVSDHVACKSLLETLLANRFLRKEEFLRCFYMVFESPYIDAFIEQYLSNKVYDSLIALIFSCREFSLDDRLKIMSLFLCHSIDIYFEDVCILYERHGFDECIEMILINGCIIQLRDSNNPFNFTLYKICYDTDPHIDDVRINYSRPTQTQNFLKFFSEKIHPAYTGYRFNQKEDIYEVIEAPSLLQLSRDTVRSLMYKIWCTNNSFKVYQALSRLPVPRVIKDILFLKKPIYY